MTRTILTISQEAALSIVPGGSAAGRLSVVVSPGYHVQANPASDEFLIPLQLEIQPRDGLRTGDPTYPPGQPHRLEGTDSDLWIYTGTFELLLPIMAAPSAVPGEYVLDGSLRYQACDSRSCLAPTSVPVEIAVRVGLGPE